MTKDIKQIQEENRKLILEAIHGVSYEEALEKEFFGRIIKLQPNEISISGINKFLGKPITLSRALIALKEKGLLVDVGLSDYSSKSKFRNESGMLVTLYGDYFKQFYWELSKETLEEQSEQTQRSIWELLKGENNDK